MYAKRLALQDKRVNALPKQFFMEWSFIISYGDVQAQDVHVDVPANNFQFGVILQDGDAGTVVMERHDGPDTAEDLLLRMWRINDKSTHLIQFPDSLKQLFTKNKKSNKRLVLILRAFGPLLWSPSSRSRILSAEKLIKCKGLKCGELGDHSNGPKARRMRTSLLLLFCF